MFFRNVAISQIHHDLHRIGVFQGDTILIHSSYKSLGQIEGGAKTFFDAIISFLGENGTLILPSLSYEYVSEDQPQFHILNTPSCIGYLPEYFRTKVEGVSRSLHATHSCCAFGRLAKDFVSYHELDDTPVGEHSPFRKLPAFGGKILFVGCSTDRNTSMHGVEEIADPPYWLSRERTIEYELTDDSGNLIHRPSFRHNFVMDGRHVVQKYSRIENLLNEQELKHGKILQADSTLMLASAVWEKGIKKMREVPWYFVD